MRIKSSSTTTSNFRWASSFLPAAGARLDDAVIGFFLAAGINIKYGYGMTETCATVSCWEENHYKLGSIGTPLPGLRYV